VRALLSRRRVGLLPLLERLITEEELGTPDGLMGPEEPMLAPIAQQGSGSQGFGGYGMGGHRSGFGVEDQRGQGTEGYGGQEFGGYDYIEPRGRHAADEPGGQRGRFGVEWPRGQGKSLAHGAESQESEEIARLSNLCSSSTNIPKAFLCPISHDVMQDPVVAGDGHTYDRSSISQWLLRSSKSPMTGEILENNSLLPNFTLRSMIKEHLSLELSAEGAKVQQ